MQVGDVVLMKDESKISSSYKLGKVSKTFPGDDGKIRRVVVEYKNVTADSDIKNLKIMQTERSIHGLVVICPVEEDEKTMAKKIEDTLKAF